MWWCCLAKGQDTKGCKQSKHEPIPEDEGESDQENDKKNKSYLIRCRCCKEIGHSIETCPRDPNIKTVNQAELDAEAERILRMKDYKKVFAETQITTTHLLKQCTAVPKISSDYNTFGMNRAEAERQRKENEMQSERYQTQIFYRGAMKFDDVNYEAYNKYILVDPDSSADGDEGMSPSDGKSMKPKSEKPSENKNNMEDGQSLQLTEKNMETTELKDYRFGELNTLTQEEEEEQACLEKMRLEEQRRLERIEKERIKMLE